MTARKSSVVVALVVVVALQPALVTTAMASPQTTPTASIASADATNVSDAAIADQHPPDPEEDVLGWEDGYWYNESISVTPEDGLNDSELDAVVARGMARVEEIRHLEFEETPPVEVISREEYSRQVANRTENTSQAQRLHQNVKYEALLMVDESTDVISVQERNQAGGVGGFYDPSTGEIKIVSENTETPQMNEITLSQELFHALQDQQFNISSFNQTTQELHNAKDGIIEGDGNYVDYLYQERCANEWAGTCVVPSQDSQVPSDFSPHIGLYQITLQPYSDGPAFVKEIRADGGWDAVNAVYENPPASTEQTIHPEKYGDDEPTPVSIEDTSDDRWRVLEMDEGVNYASFGEAGLFVALWYPSFESRSNQIISINNHINSGDTLDPYNYNHTYTNGWDGDKLLPYVTDESSETNETGYVYKTVWDAPEDAEQFQDGYEQLLEFHGAESVDGYENVYRIPDEQAFGDAFSLNRTGTRFTIVNAPSVEELPSVRDGAAPEGSTESDETPTEPDETTTSEPDDTTAEPTETTTEPDETTATSGETTTGSTTGADTTTDGSVGETTVSAGEPTTQSTDTTTTSGPGFTGTAVLIALVAFVSIVRRRG